MAKRKNSGNPALRDISEQDKLEYAELNEYGRSVYESFYRLAQMSFVIHPALVSALYFFVVNREKDLRNFQVFAILICILGMIYSLGAFRTYWQSHKFLESLLLGIQA